MLQYQIQIHVTGVILLYGAQSKVLSSEFGMILLLYRVPYKQVGTFISMAKFLSSVVPCVIIKSEITKYVQSTYPFSRSINNKTSGASSNRSLILHCLLVDSDSKPSQTVVTPIRTLTVLSFL